MQEFTTKFLCKETFRFSARQAIVFLGEITEGQVNTAQTLLFEQNDKHPQLRLKIFGVDNGMRSTSFKVGIMVKLESIEEIEKIMSYNITDEIGQVIE